MAVTNLRRATAQGNELERALSGISANEITIQSVKSAPVEPLIEKYPFDQYSYKGTFTYQETSNYTSGRTISVDFEFRDESGLFLIELKTDVPSVDAITNSLANAIPQNITVYRNLHAAEDALWDFLEQADRIIDIKVLKEGKELSYNDVEGETVEDVIGNYAIERAQVGFNYQDQQIVVDYRQGELQIESNWEEAREYIIQLFEREVLAV